MVGVRVGGRHHLVRYSSMHVGLLHCSNEMTGGVHFIKQKNTTTMTFVVLQPNERDGSLGVNRISGMEVMPLVRGTSLIKCSMVLKSRQKQCFSYDFIKFEKKKKDFFCVSLFNFD